MRGYGARSQTRMGIRCDRQGGYHVHARLLSSRAFDDSGACHVLRRHGPLQERPLHDDALLHSHGRCHDHLGTGRIFGGLWPRHRRDNRRPGPCRAERNWNRPPPDLRRYHPGACLHGLSDDVCDNHAGAHKRRCCRKDKVLFLSRLHSPVAGRRILTTRALGVGWRVDRQYGSPRFCRWYRSSHKFRGFGPCSRHRSGKEEGVQDGDHRSAQPSRYPSWNGFALVRLVRVQRRIGSRNKRPCNERLRRHAYSRCLRCAGMAPL